VLGHEHGISLLFDPGDRFSVDVVVTGENEEVVRDLRLGRPEGVGGPELPLLHDDLDRGFKPVEVPDDVFFTVADHHNDIADPVLQQSVDDVLDDRPVCDREHGFGLAPGERPEAAPFSRC